MSIFPKIPAVQNMIELTQEQNERNRGNETEDIRIQAAKFYGYEQFPSLTNRLFGNGVFTFKSAWGRQMQAVTESERVYAVDVGIFGFNWSFGIFPLFAYWWYSIKLLLSGHKNMLLVDITLYGSSFQVLQAALCYILPKLLLR